MNPCAVRPRVCRRLLIRFDSAVGRSSGVVPGQDFVGPVDDTGLLEFSQCEFKVPGQDFVGPVDDGVDDVFELGQFTSFVEVTEPVERFERAVVLVG